MSEEGKGLHLSLSFSLSLSLSLSFLPLVMSAAGLVRYHNNYGATRSNEASGVGGGSVQEINPTQPILHMWTFPTFLAPEEGRGKKLIGSDAGFGWRREEAKAGKF